ncbi:MAG TPA: RNA methyltransferase [Candidatus Binatia bacterium]|nr:RNA methyltransferase [Candidatus Binatia bacterium]
MREKITHSCLAPNASRLDIRVVLVRPKGSGNIGSVARAMKNFGARDLAVVGGGRTESFLARSMAAHAREVLKSARRFATLRDAVADCGLVVGTTCRGGLYREHSLPPREMAPAIAAAARNAKCALVFGPEDHGLSNEDLKHCQRLITIPTDPEYPSLNLAQAATVCLYEIFLASLGADAGEDIERAPAEDVERLFDKMKTSLLEIGYLDPQNPEHILLAFRRIFGRSGLEEKDVRILIGLFRQIDWYSREGWKIAEEKKRKGLKIR